MTNELGTAVLKLKTDDSEFNAGVDRAEKKAGFLGLSLNRVGDIAGGMLTRDVIRAGFDKFEAFIKGALDDANAYAKVQAQLAAVIKSTGGAAGESVPELNEQAKAFQDTTTYAHTAVSTVQALLLTFTDIKSNIFPQATSAVLDMATALGEDTSGAAIQLGKALQDPILGVTSLRRVGVQLSDQQQQLVKDLIATNQKGAAQAIILAEINKEFGGSAAAQADTFSGKLAQIGNRFTDLKEKIGFVIEGGLSVLFSFVEAHKADIDKWIDRIRSAFDFIAPFIETRLGGVIAVITSLYKIVATAADLIDSVIHGDWKSAWQDAKDIPEELLKLLLADIAQAYGTLPNIMIKAVQAGINGVIDLLNSIPEIKTPGFNIPGLGDVGSQKIFGGFDIGHVNLPELNLPKLSFGDVGNAISDLEKKGEQAKPPVVALGSAYEDTGKAADKAGKSIQDMIQDMLGKIRGVGSALFAMPTREVANLQLQVDQLQEKADGISMRLQPSIDALGKLKDGIVEAANASKDAIQAQKDALDASKDLINKTKEGIQDALDALDSERAVRDKQINAFFDAAEGKKPKVLTPRERALALDDQYYNMHKDQLTAQDKAADKQLKSIDEHSKALDANAKKIDANTKKETEALDKRIKSYQSQIDAAAHQVQLVQDQIKLHDDEKKVMQDILTLSDRTLLSEQEQKTAFEQVKTATANLTQGVLDMVGGVKQKLIPGFDALTKAKGPLDLLDTKASNAAAALDKVVTSASNTNIAKLLSDTITNIFSNKNSPLQDPNGAYQKHLRALGENEAPDVPAAQAYAARLAQLGETEAPDVPTNGILRGIGARAFGGPVQAGQPYWVGERGVKELFVPHQDGSIIPSGQSGMITLNIPNATFNVRNPDEVKTTAQSIAWQITQEMRKRGASR